MNHKKFTTYQRDQESGLDYAMARFYGDYTGRFMSPDPLTSSALPKRSQTWHRYVYNWNDPVNLIDPNGLAPRLPKTTAGKWECTSGADGLEHCQPADDPDEETSSHENGPQLKIGGFVMHISGSPAPRQWKSQGNKENHGSPRRCFSFFR